MSLTREPFPDSISVILLPIDGSENSERAARVAADLTLLTNAKLIIMHVINVGLMEQVAKSLGRSVNELREEYRKEARGLLDRHTKTLSARSITPLPLLEFGLPSDKIIQAAAEHHADLIVMGARGIHKQTRIEVSIGSSTDRVMRLAGCSVLVVR